MVTRSNVITLSSEFGIPSECRNSIKKMICQKQKSNILATDLLPSPANLYSDVSTA